MGRTVDRGVGASRRWLAAVACAAAAIGCSPRAPSRPRPRARAGADASRAAAAPSLGALAGADAASDGGGGPSEAPRELPGPLAACVRRLQSETPRELRAALDAVDYDSVAEDACRLDFAVSTHDGTLCDGVQLSSVRERCRERAAVVSGRPDDCPPAPADRGKDPVCVALAARDARLCAAAALADRPRCLALARGTPAPCATLDAILRPRCEGELAALRGQLPVDRREPLPAGTAHLRITAGPAPDAGAVLRDEDLSHAVARGVFASPDGTVWVLDPEWGWPSPFAHPLGRDALAVGVALAQPARPGPGAVRDFRVVLPDGSLIEPSPAYPAGELHVATVAHARGETVTASATLHGFLSGRPVTLELELRAFVRDFVTPEVLGRE